MSRTASRTSLWSTLSGIGWPIMIGCGLSAGFYALLYRGPLDQPVLHRYFAGHPVCIVETVFLFVCLAALGQKFFDVVSQYSSFGSITLPPIGERSSTTAAADLLDVIAGLSDRVKRSYLGRRLTSALEFVERKGSADGLASELNQLAELDSVRQQDSYSLVRIIVWATPMMGFLGTVIGITHVIADLAKQDMANIDQVMEGLLSGLYVKFDTTALALSFTMLLMFVQFIVDRLETQLLEAVEQRANDELLDRFAVVGTSSDPNIQQIQMVAQTMLRGSEQLVQRQAEIWMTSIDAAHQQWSQLAAGAGETLQTALTASLDQSLRTHAATMAKIDHAGGEQLQHRFEQWQTVLSDNARLMHAQQQELVRQGDMLTQLMRATGDVVQLEQALNSNLNALAGSKNFADTVMSLSAAIHLLNVQLGRPVESAHVALKAPQQKGRAA